MRHHGIAQYPRVRTRPTKALKRGFFLVFSALLSNKLRVISTFTLKAVISKTQTGTERQAERKSQMRQVAYRLDNRLSQ